METKTITGYIYDFSAIVVASPDDEGNDWCNYAGIHSGFEDWKVMICNTPNPEENKTVTEINLWSPFAEVAQVGKSNHFEIGLKSPRCVIATNDKARHYENTSKEDMFFTGYDGWIGTIDCGEESITITFELDAGLYKQDAILDILVRQMNIQLDDEDEEFENPDDYSFEYTEIEKVDVKDSSVVENVNLLFSTLDRIAHKYDTNTDQLAEDLQKFFELEEDSLQEAQAEDQ